MTQRPSGDVGDIGISRFTESSGGQHADARERNPFASTAPGGGVHPGSASTTNASNSTQAQDDNSNDLAENNSGENSDPRRTSDPSGSRVLTRLIVSIGSSDARGGGLGNIYPIAESMRARRQRGAEDTARTTPPHPSGTPPDQQPSEQIHTSAQEGETQNTQEAAAEDVNPSQDFANRASASGIIAINVVLSVLTQIIRDGMHVIFILRRPSVIR